MMTGKPRWRKTWLFATPLLVLACIWLPKLYFHFKPVEVAAGLSPMDNADTSTSVIMRLLATTIERPLYSYARVFVIKWSVENPFPDRGGNPVFLDGRCTYDRSSGSLVVEQISHVPTTLEFDPKYKLRDDKHLDRYTQVTDNAIRSVARAGVVHQALTAYGSKAISEPK